MADLPTGTSTFLFTDIEGSTQRWEQNPQGMAAALTRHDTILHEAIRGAGGAVFKTVGDAFCAVFPAASEALTAALVAQRALQAGDWAAIGGLPVRMALHTGPAEARDGDYFGPSLNRVARLLVAGHGGQILLSFAAQEGVRNRLPPDVTLRDLGEQRLKDLIHPERVFQVVTTDLPSSFPPLRSLEAFAHNLPIQLTSFIGRQREMVEVQRLLGGGPEGPRLLTLTGTGGTGKTRLALQVAAELLDRYPDGVWLIELAAMTDPTLVPQAAAAALGVREEPGRPLATTLTESVQGKQLLLVLDNCEHLVAACAHLADLLLRACPRLRILTTSREPLGISGETILRVPSLALPDPRRPPEVQKRVAALVGCEAVRLFVERATAVQPSFALTPQNAPAVAQICTRLDGIPLALELAAARVKGLAVEQIAARLDDRFRLLTGGSRTALPRQQTLRALIDWSHDLLSTDERVLLRRLAVFVSGWTLDAAEAVAGEVGSRREEGGSSAREGSAGLFPDSFVLDALIGLVNKSLVVAEEHEDQTRYYFLETIRQYARDRLAEAGESEAWRRRHRDWYLALAEQAETACQGIEQAGWLERLGLEHDNLRAALEWAHATAGEEPAELRLAGALGRFWRSLGFWSEGRAWLDGALDRPGAAAPTPARAKALAHAGALAITLGDNTAGRARLDESIQLWRALGGGVYMAWALLNLGALLRVLGDAAAARAQLRESMAIYQALGDRAGQADGLSELARLALDAGDAAAARGLFEESLVLHRAVGDLEGTARCLYQLGRTALAGQDYAAARTLFIESLSLFRDLNSHDDVAWALNSLGELARVQGDYEGAAAFYEESLAVARSIEYTWAIAAVLHNLGQVALAGGDRARAAALFGESLVLARDLGRKMGMIEGLVGLAHVAVAAGRLIRAARLLGAAQIQLDALSLHLTPADHAAYERSRAIVHAGLDLATWEAAGSAGAALPLDAAIAYAATDGPDD